MKIIVLGAGLVGSAIAKDLAGAFEVTSADINEAALKPLSAHSIKTKQADLSKTMGLKDLVKEYDLVVGAVPGFMGYNTVKAVIEAGKNIVDISFFPEDPLELDQLAKEKKVCAVVDCGVAPGMGNIILGYHNQAMEVTDYECLVGGLPLVREWPWEYKAVFSPIDVIEEYTRPARYVQNSREVVREALSDPELVHFEKAGTLESWNSDGLRSLIKTMPHIPNMIEKTLRYPGTIEYLRVLRETGFFSDKPIEVNGQQIKPIELTSKLLFPMWKLKPGEQEFTVMRIKISGNENGAEVQYEYNLHDVFHQETGISSMARTTGYTCNAVVHLISADQFNKPGVHPPEYLGEDPDNFHFIVDYLKERGVVYHVSKGGV